MKKKNEKRIKKVAQMRPGKVNLTLLYWHPIVAKECFERLLQGPSPQSKSGVEVH